LAIKSKEKAIVWRFLSANPSPTITTRGRKAAEYKKKSSQSCPARFQNSNKFPITRTRRS